MQSKQGALRAKSTLLAKDPDYYKKLGRSGGVVKGRKGFATLTPEQRQEIGRKGGQASRRPQTTGDKINDQP